jgi:NTP pyrophosphatase (non-canonical NTP hydrolase)
MTEHFNKLTPSEAELLALLAEECAEVIQAVGKTLRHGLESRAPPTSDGRWRDTNRVWLCQEMGDVRAAMILLCDAGIVEKQSVHDFADSKLARVGKFLHHSSTTVGAGRGK